MSLDLDITAVEAWMTKALLIMQWDMPTITDGRGFARVDRDSLSL